MSEKWITLPIIVLQVIDFRHLIHTYLLFLHPNFVGPKIKLTFKLGVRQANAICVLNISKEMSFKPRSNLQWNWKILKSLWPSKQGKWIGRNKRIFEREEKISTLFHFEFLVDNVPEEPPSLQCCLLSRFLSWNGLGTSTPPPSSEEKIFTNTHTLTHIQSTHVVIVHTLTFKSVGTLKVWKLLLLLYRQT